MKAVIGSVQIEIRLLLIGPLIIIVAKLMMNSNEIVAINLGAHLDTDIVLVVDIPRSEEHTSELQSLMRISYAVFCLKKKKKTQILQESPYKLYTQNITQQ